MRPEFLSRVDEIVVFSPLKEEDYVKIAGLMLEELVEPLKEKGIHFGYTSEARRNRENGLRRKSGAVISAG